MIFVTGASGFIGAHLCRALRQRELPFVAFGGMRPAPIQVIDGIAARISNNDISQFCQLATKFSPSAVVHLAALASTAECESQPERARAANQDLVASLTQALPSLTHIYVSTDLVYEGKTAPFAGISIQDQPQAVTTYARTKLEGERITLSSSRQNLVVRVCLTYGVKLFERGCFINWIIEALRHNQPVRLFVDEYRTAVYVGDVVDGLIALTQRVSDELVQERRIFHFAGPQRMSRFEFGQQLADKLGLRRDLIIAAKREQVSTGVYRAADVSLNGVDSWKSLGITARALSDLPLECLEYCS